MYQSGRVGDEAKKRKSPAKSGRVGIYAFARKNSGLSIRSGNCQCSAGIPVAKHPIITECLQESLVLKGLCPITLFSLCNNSCLL